MMLIYVSCEKFNGKQVLKYLALGRGFFGMNRRQLSTKLGRKKKQRNIISLGVQS